MSHFFSFFQQLLDSKFMPHGHCYLWLPEILWLNVGSDALIAIAYFSIPVALLTFVQRRGDLAFSWIFVLFAAFIFFCGTTHLFSIWTVWHGTYRLEGLVKLLTALVSAATAVALWPLIPRALALPSPRQLRQEIAERNRAQQSLREINIELKRRAASLEELDAAKTEFFSNISHEFRTPLTLILGPIEQLLEQENLPERSQQQLTTIRRNANRLLGLVNSVLDFSAIDAGKLTPVFEPSDLSTLTSQTASAFESAARPEDVRFTVSCPPLPEPVYIDRSMWERIVANLLSNAFKFTKRGEISLSLSSTPHEAILSVADTGIGIPKSETGHLFERFYRVESEYSDRELGTGIGLALIDEYVKLHGGTIEVESSPGKGSNFRVRIPFGDSHLPQHAVRESSSMPAADEQRRRELSYIVEQSSGILSANRKRQAFAEVDGSAGAQMASVLVVDDNADMRQYLKQILEPEYRVITAERADTALQRLRSEQPEAVLSDIMMPGLDGLSLLQQVREDPELRYVPVLLISARAGEEAMVAGLSEGADDYLAKPFSKRQLLARLQAAIDRSRHLKAKASMVQRQLAALAQHSADGIIGLGPDARIKNWNSGAANIFGYTQEEAVGSRLSPLISRESGSDAIDSAVDAILQGEDFQAADAEIISKDGGVHFASITFSAIRRKDGTLEGISVIARDITAQKRAEEQQRLLLAELNHRVKNSLATVQSLASETAYNSTSYEEFRTAFEGRLSALAKAHTLISRKNWQGAWIDEIVAQEIEPYETQPVSRFRINGPAVLVDPSIVLAFHLLLHELLTNAAKYGALSVSEGSVDLEWGIAESDDKVWFHWSEHGGPLVKEPTRQGFGNELIQSVVECDLDGTITMEYRESGVVCNVSFPNDYTVVSGMLDSPLA